jgi:hypothetical protein
MHMPLPPLRLTVQSRRGVIQILEAQTHSLTKAISKFIQMQLPLPGLTALKAYAFE